MNREVPAPVVPTDGRWRLLAFGWGLAEATCFFIVPDVLSTRLALGRPRAAFQACAYSLAGALTGGGLLYVLGGQPALAPHLLAAADWLPGINAGLIAQARADLAGHGWAALFRAAANGVPYKLYASQAAAAGINAGIFLLASAAARLARFLLTTAVAWWVGTRLLPNFSSAAKLRIHAAGWALFYLGYFWRMGF